MAQEIIVQQLFPKLKKLLKADEHRQECFKNVPLYPNIRFLERDGRLTPITNLTTSVS